MVFLGGEIVFYERGAPVDASGKGLTRAVGGGDRIHPENIRKSGLHGAQ